MNFLSVYIFSDCSAHPCIVRKEKVKTVDNDTTSLHSNGYFVEKRLLSAKGESKIKIYRLKDKHLEIMPKNLHTEKLECDEINTKVAKIEKRYVEYPRVNC